jgi:hypothetical protein
MQPSFRSEVVLTHACGKRPEPAKGQDSHRTRLVY